MLSRGAGEFCANPSCTRVAAPGGSLCFGCIRTYRARTQAIHEPQVKLYAVTGAGLVKIGITSGAMSRRLFAMQTGSPVKLTLIGYLITGGHNEGRVHSACRRQRLHGEWFKPEGNVLKVLEFMDRKDAPALEAFLALHRF